MSDRVMIDCINANVNAVPFTGAQLAAGYDTGSPDVRWSAASWQHVQQLGLVPVHIDQGYTGSPVATSNVRDVEVGAWSPQAAVNKAGWKAERPTIYAPRDDMTTVINLGWRDDIWLAWPLPDPPTKAEVLAAFPLFGKANLIGVQYAQNVSNLYDQSVVYDPYWPHKAPEEDYMRFPGIPGVWIQATQYVDVRGTAYVVGLGTDGRMWVTSKPVNGKWSAPKQMP